MHRLILLLSVAVPVLVTGCAQNTVNVPGTPVGAPAKPVAVKSDGKNLELIAVKNARVYFHPDEAEINGGGCHRLRASDIAKNSAEVSVMDFDRAALKAFLDKNKTKTVSGKLVLAIRELQSGPAKMEVAALDTASDWTEGNKSQQKADKGEVCFVAAQFGVKPWTTAEGKPRKDLGELFYNATSKTAMTLLNPSSVTVKDANKMNSVTIELDSKFVEHLATDPNCKGIIVFTGSDNAKVNFSSRDKEGKEPRLVLTVK